LEYEGQEQPVGGEVGDRPGEGEQQGNEPADEGPRLPTGDGVARPADGDEVRDRDGDDDEPRDHMEVERPGRAVGRHRSGLALR
jgi:hypothetical protein